MNDTGVNYNNLSLREIADRISDGVNALILTHVNPDGDCIGSAFALLGLIRACGGEGKVACPTDVPKRLRFLCGDQTDFSSEGADEYDIIIAVDVASPVQLGSNSELIGKIDIMIDHHGMGEAYADNYIDHHSAAAGEIIFELYKILREDGKIGSLPAVARLIYAAIISDTGSFKQANTTPRTHIIASELVGEINTADDGGADTTEVARSLFGQRTLTELRAQMVSIQNLRLYEEGRLGVVLFTRDMLTEAGLTDEDIGNAVETPRGVEGVLVGLSLKQSPDDLSQYRVSSRANAEIDCSAVCAKFGGGGHARAAGCVISGDTPEDAVKIAICAFGEAIRAYLASKQ